MSLNDPKPSQAEGEDPDRPTGPPEGTSGHPSQAEGEDQVVPDTGGPDDTGGVEVDPDDLNMPGHA